MNDTTRTGACRAGPAVTARAAAWRAANALWATFVLVAAATTACASDSRSDSSPALETRALVQDMRIDGYAADLVPVGWMGVSPNGTIAIMQPQDNDIRFFDADGNALGTVGHKGRGPGEFEAPMRGGWIGDTLWVSDVDLRRVTLISPSQAVVRTLPPLTSARPRPEDAGRIPRFTFAFPYGYYAGDVALIVAIGSANDPLAAAIEGTPLVRVSSDGIIERIVTELPQNDGMVRVQFEGGTGSVAVPFFARPLWSISPDGSRIASITTDVEGPDAGTFRVVVSNALDGVVMLDRRYPFDGIPIPNGVIDSVSEARAGRASVPALADAMRDEAKRRAPHVYPPLRVVFIGSDQRVWIGLRATAGGNPWLILSADGDPADRIIVPPNVTLTVADGEHVWGVETDDVGVESIVRFPLRRDTGTR